ncbi:MAG: hypothetical protein HQL90_09590 [Magnetococcales bacterium]|nr:hypothetical protein [Magnetococcales bacterium]
MKKSMVSDVVSDPVCDNNDTHLWMAVMDRAVRDLVALERYRQDPAIMEDPVFRYDYRTLKKWFHSTSMEPGSFNWICSLVNIDPKWALNRLEDRLKVCLVPESRRTRMRVDLSDSAEMPDLPELSEDDLTEDESAEAA